MDYKRSLWFKEGESVPGQRRWIREKDRGRDILDAPFLVCEHKDDSDALVYYRGSRGQRLSYCVKCRARVLACRDQVVAARRALLVEEA